MRPPLGGAGGRCRRWQLSRTRARLAPRPGHMLPRKGEACRRECVVRGQEPGVERTGEPWGETQAAGLGPSREGTCEDEAGTLGGRGCRASRVGQALVSVGE